MYDYVTRISRKLKIYKVISKIGLKTDPGVF